ncbi:MAG TPA: iron-sulfur cluster assembly accessory protein [Candidatus Norongarragalinales archaeon]|nr:iron-sulfur cluster assembly accessory protein [Candidatus Norongarragalinales archaeon]
MGNCSGTDPYMMPNPPADSMSPGVIRGQSVTKEMLIGDVVAAYPEAVDVMLSNGFHCIGCSVSPYESISAGAMSHGFTSEQVDALLVQINQAIAGKPALQSRERKGVHLTSSAVGKLKSLMEKEGKVGMGLRIAVVGGGCAGNSYEMDFDQPKEGDDLFENDGLKVFYDKAFQDQLGGIEIDYRDTLQSSGFVMRNPNAKASCGCGSSFG